LALIVERLIHGVLIGKLPIGHLHCLRLRTASHEAPREEEKVESLEIQSSEERRTGNL
jgi:hypothetical protein